MVHRANKVLPKGVTKELSGDDIVYRVRFMVDGARINLGTFTGAETAIHAMLDWKRKDMLKAVSNLPKIVVTSDSQLLTEVLDDAVLDRYSKESVDAWEEQLAQLPSALLDETKATVLADGSIIPALIVKSYLHKLYLALESNAANT